MSLLTVKVLNTLTADDHAAMAAIRDAVFVQEHGLHPTIAHDDAELPADTVHFLGFVDNIAIAYLRLRPHTHEHAAVRCYKLERMVVQADSRRQGYAHQLLREAVRFAQQQRVDSLHLHAQSSVVDFYAAQGWQVQGDSFIEADIAHQKMQLPLTQMLRLGLEQNATMATMTTACTSAIGGVLCNARRRVYVLESQLQSVLYDHRTVEDGLRRFTTVDRQAHVQVLLREAQDICHAQTMQQLIQRLPSSFTVRILTEAADLSAQECWILNDTGGYFLRPRGALQGHYALAQPAQARQLQEQFDALWNRAEPYTQFRALGI